MEKYIDFDFGLKNQVIECVKNISNSKVITKMNNIRENNTSYFRLTVIGKEEEIDIYLEEFNSLLILE
jgi:Zn-dependent metalloprotease